MYHPTRIFIIGHPGAGKALLGKSLAEKLGWTFIHADFELEFKVGETIEKILGNEGVEKFQKKYQDIIQNLPEKTVVSIDSCIISIDVEPVNGLVVYLKSSTPVQLTRVTRNQPPLLLSGSLEMFLDMLHQERDKQYEELADLNIDSDDNALELHLQTIIDNISSEEITEPVLLEQRDMIMMHHTLHHPVKLTKQQAYCLKLLAHGKSNKEIARILNISHRTVDGHLNRLMEALGCVSGKELVKLYFYKP